MTPDARRRKRLGQHFLRDAATIARIIDAAAPQADERFVEIGPGDGALTRPLLARGARLDAIEVDARLAHRLQAACGACERFTLHVRDALDYFPPLDGPARLIGNLPYSVATPLILRLLERTRAGARIIDMHFMLQLEVAARLAARPGDAAYSRLSVAAGCDADAELLFEIPPEAFAPPPQVRSAMVRLRPRAPCVAPAARGAFEQIVRAAFAARRKTVANALKTLLDRAAIEALGIDPERRAQMLAAREFAALARALAAAKNGGMP